MSWAQVQHDLLRRVTVFPFKVQKSMSGTAEQAWWDVREALTQNRRFFVASKNFLKKKDVYQARAELSPADAIILGQLLDAQALVTTFVDKRTLQMRVYEGSYGRLLWDQEVRLHPSIPVRAQIKEASKKLIRDFIASIPYQGFVVVDSLVGKPLIERDGATLFTADVGINSQVEVGDKVQLVKVYSDRLRPLFTEGATTEVFAEGKVLEVKREFATVELLRVTNRDEVKHLSLVRLPKEFKRIRQSFAIRDDLYKKINPDYFSPEITELDHEEAEKKPLMTSLSFLSSLAVFLLLAF